MKNADASKIHELTRAEITRQVAALNVRRADITRQMAAWYANVSKQGFDSTTVMVDADERAAREHAKGLLNGAAPASLSLPPDISLDRQLSRERRGIDIVLEILSDKDLVARAAEAVTWAEENRSEWLRLAREIVLTATRLEALKRRAQGLLDSCPDIYAVRLPMPMVSHHLHAVNPSEMPLEELSSAAIAEGDLTPSEIRKSQNVE